MSGFCALGYEVLWSRILTIVVGASVYGFTIMLVAFLAGIALGSEAYGLFPKIFKITDKGPGRAIFWFGIVQVIIGVTALLVTLYIRDLPANIAGLQNFFLKISPGYLQRQIMGRFRSCVFVYVRACFFHGACLPAGGKSACRT